MYVFNSTLAVILISYGIISALNLGNNIKGTYLCRTVFLAVFGAMGNRRYTTVLCGAVGELAAVGETLGVDTYSVAAVHKRCLMLAAFVECRESSAVFVYLVFGVDL